ncbi:hypothetical protein A265_00783 [Zymomonas mobilis subsp. mobilis str. CP4 = NRRL B-14023]|nr:hypothetical protein ZCP4_0793 [Zymomonas mobilis subsp. mobilis str. CP4 = NRRL B-14023]AHJ70404.1 hypothetical protein A254_00783 [Zymomonas mobilis subsp. mobilis NRRL B-12526]AHJ72259.1 hypothetical protein A265_00783 [Zymomonas mobilis subsp. mobilis str. CP4 = NRRL B-14023]TWE25879.1 hypothetical protein FBY52_103161 [Zymomonas mobilis]
MHFKAKKSEFWVFLFQKLNVFLVNLMAKMLFYSLDENISAEDSGYFIFLGKVLDRFIKKTPPRKAELKSLIDYLLF